MNFTVFSLPRRIAGIVAGLALAAFWVLSGPPALAGTTGTIRGHVTEGVTPIAGVVVSAVSPTGSYRATTDAKGFYVMTGVVSDTYTVSFSKPGFQPSSDSGVTVFADQVASLDASLTQELKTIATVTVHSPGGAFQPEQTQDTYTVTSQQITTILGKKNAVSESDLLASLPGASYDSSGYPVLRGGRENEEGFQFEGIDYTDAFTSQFINSLALDPAVGSLQLTPGAGDASSGNTGTGIINLLAKRGTYPASGDTELLIGGPSYNHQLSFDYGLATPNGKFSDYVSFLGSRQSGANYGRNAYPAQDIGRFFSVTDQNGNDFINNFVYKFGNDQRKSIQVFYQTEIYHFFNNYGGYSNLTYKQADPYWLANFEAFTGLTAPQLQSLIPLLPYQPSATANLPYSPENYFQPNETFKVQYNDNISDSTFLALKYYRVNAVTTFDFPFNGQGVFAPGFNLQQGGQRNGVALDISRQVNAKNLVTFGGKYEFLHPVFNFFDPYDSLSGSLFFTGQLYDFISPTDPNCPLGAGGCGYLYQYFPNGPGTIPSLIQSSVTNRQDFAAYVTDSIDVSKRLKVDAGLRLDGSNYQLPADPTRYNPAIIDPATGYPVNAAGQDVTATGQPYVINVPNEARIPRILEPRFAASYKLGNDDALRFAYNRTVEFPSLGTVDYNVAASSYNQFLKVPSYSAYTGQPAATCGVTGNLTCANYADELAWAAQNFFGGVPIQPVKPETFSNFEFSYSHRFHDGVAFKVTPFYRHGFDATALVAQPRIGANGQPILNANGSFVLGPPTATNLGTERTTGVEFLVTKEGQNGLSGQISGTYINEFTNVIPGSVNEDFFPSIPPASLALGNLYRVGFLAPFQATLALQYKTKSGWRINPVFHYWDGYPIGQGTLTASFVNGVAYNVANTNVTNPNGATSATQYVDPQNPGSLLAPNIAASRGTAEGASAGGILSSQQISADLTIEYNPHHSANTFGLQIANLFGNVYNGFGVGNPVSINTRYQPVATGVSGPQSGYSALAAAFPTLGSAAYWGPEQFGQSAYRIAPAYNPTEYSLYFQRKF